jgi:sulfatase maturation enzyme AslB (radical SAM superfamily)
MIISLGRNRAKRGGPSMEEAWFFACNGECPKNRFLKTPDGQPGLNYLCSGMKRFLQYADPHFRQIAARMHGAGTVDAIA